MNEIVGSIIVQEPHPVRWRSSDESPPTIDDDAPT